MSESTLDGNLPPTVSRVYRRTASGSYGGTPHVTTTAQFVAGTYSVNVTSSVAAACVYKGVFTPATGSQDALTLNGDTSGEKQVTFSTAHPC